jgi:hypothetical protein
MAGVGRISGRCRSVINKLSAFDGWIENNLLKASI